MVDVYFVLRKHIHGLLEFILLLGIGIVIVGLILGSWDLTPTLVFVDVVQNIIVFVWLKWKRELVLWLERVVRFIQES